MSFNQWRPAVLHSAKEHVTAPLTFISDNWKKNERNGRRVHSEENKNISFTEYT